jgi:hypothetical protein
METAQSMTIEQAFYLLKHFTEIDFIARNQFLEFGYSEEEINAQLQVIGSKFTASFCQHPFELEGLLSQIEPREQIVQSNGRTAYVYQFEKKIGTDHIIEKEQIAPIEIIQLDRNGSIIEAVEQKELPKTNHLVVVKSNQGAWITAFPGKYAPAFPSSWMTKEEFTFATHFWHNHVFIVQHTTN